MDSSADIDTMRSRKLLILFFPVAELKPSPYWFSLEIAFEMAKKLIVSHSNHSRILVERCGQRGRRLEKVRRR